MLDTLSKLVNFYDTSIKQELNRERFILVGEHFHQQRRKYWDIGRIDLLYSEQAVLWSGNIATLLEK